MNTSQNIRTQENKCVASNTIFNGSREQALAQFPMYQKQIKASQPTTVIVIPRAIQSDEPLVIKRDVHDDDTLRERMLIVVQEGARVVLDEQLRSIGATTVERSVDVYIEQAAHVTYVYDQQWSSQTTDTAQYRFYGVRESTLELFPWLVGAQCAALTLEVHLDGKGAQATIKGLCHARDQQKLTVTTRQHHAAPHTQSSLALNSLVDDQAVTTYGGMIYIAEHAAHTVASQENKNMVLSSRARAESVPAIEVLTDDVVCNHGSAVGKLDEQAVLYAQSRGLTPDAARALLLRAFVDQVFNHFPLFFRKRVQK